MAYIKENRNTDLTYLNIDFTFQPNRKTQFFSPEVTAVPSDEFSDTESDANIDNESEQHYNPEETSESDYSLTRPNSQMKVQKILFLKNQNIQDFGQACCCYSLVVLLTRRKQKLYL